MIRAGLTIAALALLASCGGTTPSTTACTHCLAVAGTYTETTTEKSVTCADGSQLIWSGGTTTYNLTQQDSTLTLTSTRGDSVKGVLHDDNSVAFDTVDAFARGNDGTNHPGRLSFVGEFTTDGAFTGTQTFVKTSDRCTIKNIVSWTKAP